MKNLIFQPLQSHTKFIFDISSPSLTSKKCESFFRGFFVQILSSGMIKRKQQTIIGICEQKLFEDNPNSLQSMLEKTIINKIMMSMAVIRKQGKYVLSMASIEFNFYVFWQLMRIAFSLLMQNRTFWLIAYLFYQSHQNYPENLLYLKTQICLWDCQLFIISDLVYIRFFYFAVVSISLMKAKCWQHTQMRQRTSLSGSSMQEQLSAMKIRMLLAVLQSLLSTALLTVSIKQAACFLTSFLKMVFSSDVILAISSALSKEMSLLIAAGLNLSIENRKYYRMVMYISNRYINIDQYQIDVSMNYCLVRCDQSLKRQKSNHTYLKIQIMVETNRFITYTRNPDLRL